MLQDGVRDPALEFNLATLYHQQKLWGNALAHYYSALLYHPYNTIVLSRISAARQHLQGQHQPSILRFQAASLPAQRALIIALTALALLTFGAHLALRQRARAVTALRSPSQALRFSAYGVTACFALCSVIFVLQELEVSKQRGLVVGSKVSLHRGPDRDTEIFAKVFEGQMVTLGSRAASFRRVTTDLGEEGWVDSSAIVSIKGLDH